jgi:hypothetical protein
MFSLAMAMTWVEGWMVRNEQQMMDGERLPREELIPETEF